MDQDDEFLIGGSEAMVENGDECTEFDEECITKIVEYVFE